MGWLTAARLVITGVAIAVWGYGLKADDARIRITGMALLAVALVLRFVARRRPATPPASE